MSSSHDDHASDVPHDSGERHASPRGDTSRTSTKSPEAQDCETPTAESKSEPIRTGGLSQAELDDYRDRDEAAKSFSDTHEFLSDGMSPITTTAPAFATNDPAGGSSQPPSDAPTGPRAYLRRPPPLAPRGPRLWHDPQQHTSGDHEHTSGYQEYERIEIEGAVFSIPCGDSAGSQTTATASSADDIIGSPLRGWYFNRFTGRFEQRQPTAD